MKEAAEFAESTQILMNVSEFTDVSQATDTLISAVQAFGYTAETSMDVVDLLNTIGNNYAISTADLAKSLTKSSASLVAAGGNLAEAAALTATANAIIQDADSVGTALKTTSLRLRGTSVKVLEEEGLDSDGAVESTSKLRSQVLATSGVDILTDTGAYKSTYQILLEIAEVWDQITDDKARAGLLELLAGKRNSSVIAALLQNPEDLKAAYEDAMDAEGSALEENERYLDSIQGKIDQFNNAMQAMWSNILDSDVVKSFVEWGTKIIKSLDTVQGKFLALVKVLAIFMAYKKINPLDWITKFGDISNAIKTDGLKNYIMSLFQVSAAQKAVTADTLVSTIAQQQNDVATQQQIISKLGLTNATGALTAAQKLQAAQELVTLFNGGMISKDLATRMAAMLGYKFSVDATNNATVALDTTTKSFMASNPIGWILAIVSAVVVLVALLSKIPSHLERLEEKMSELNSEISSLESEIDSLNSELETTQERMAELLAMPSLSFTEQEELKNLQLQNAELERQIELQEILLKSKEKERAETAKEWIDNAWDGNGLDKKYAKSEYGAITEDKWYTVGRSGKEVLDESIPQYATAREAIEDLKDVYSTAQKELSENGKLSFETFKSVVDAIPDVGDNPEAYYDQKFRYSDKDLVNQLKNNIIDPRSAAMESVEDGIEMVLTDMSKIIEENELSYSMGDEDVNKFLDEYFAYQYKYQEAQGISAKSSAIASIFDDTSSDSIKKLKEDLTEIAGDDTLDAAKKQEDALELVNKAINSTSGEYDRLKTSMDIIGITADEVARYFVQLSEAPDSSTIEGITAQYQKGIDALGKYKGAATDIIAEFTDLDGAVEQITWGSLFDDEGEPIDVQISKVLQGANETTRAEFARIAKSVNEGTMSIEQAMSSFSGSGLVSVSKLIEESFGELNKSVFKGLEDEISGFIDTFGEFSAALEDVASSMDLLHTAQEQYNNSGQVSVKTALELMQSTDQWNKILTIENGKITLNAEAQDVLVQSKLNTVKANLAEAKASIQNQLAQLGAADATLLSAEASDITTEAYTIYTNAMNSYTASIAGFGAALDALVNGRIFGDDGIIGSFQSAYNATKEVKTYENTTNISALREKLAEVDQMEDFFEGVDTFDEFANNYDFDENPGDKYGNDEDSKTDEKMDAFQREMDYWENRIGANQARYEQIQNEIDLLEAKGQKADVSFYEEQMKLEGQRLTLLEGQKAAALAYLATLEEGSEEWWEVANTLNDIEGELDDVTASIVDLQDAIGEIDTYKFEEFNNRLDDITSKLGTIRDLIAPDGEEDWFDDEGNWTEEGVAVLGTYIQELETYKNGLAEAEDAYANYVKEYAGNEEYYAKLGIHSEQELYDKRQELIEQQYDYAQSISDTEQSVVDMYESNIDAIEEYTETLIDSYNDYIDSVKEALDAERDLYDFKKNVQKQSKDIAAIERRIASLSGSTNASDIAERRKLEAELYESRESLNDTYYDHARSAQDEALDAEQVAYEESMNKFIEGIRTSLETATMNMDEFLMGVTSMVMYNADTVLTKYQETNLPLTGELTNPWIKAKEAVGAYSGDALALMNRWTEEGGFFAQFNATGTKNLQSPWSAGSTAASAFKTSVSTVMEGVVSNISTNVKTASGELSKLYQQIKDTEQRAASANVKVQTNNIPNIPTKAVIKDDGPSPTLKPTVKLRGLMKTSREMILGPKSFVDANTETINGTKYYRDSKTGYYYKISDLNSKRKYDGGRTTGWAIPKGTWFYTKNAKGTTGTKRDGWGLTDEPQFGDELVLVPGKDGNLSFMRKGTGVVPADMTKKLFELAQIPTSDLMNKNLTAVVPNITKNDFKNEFNFESLVHVDTVDSDTLPKLEKMVDKKIDDFSRALNYSLKKFAR